jgi:hypothetical protein
LRIMVIYNNQVFDSFIILIINFQLGYPDWYPSGVSCNFKYPPLSGPDQSWAVFTFFKNHGFWFFMLLCENWVGSWLLKEISVGENQPSSQYFWMYIIIWFSRYSVRTHFRTVSFQNRFSILFFKS